MATQQPPEQPPEMINFWYCSHAGRERTSYWEDAEYLIKGRWYAVRWNGQWYVSKWIGLRFQIEDDSGQVDYIQPGKTEFVVALPQ